MRGDQVVVVGECRWRNRPVGPDLLAELVAYKAPALAQAGLEPAADLRLVLFSRSGFTDSARRRAHDRGSVELVDAATVADGLMGI